MRDILRAVGMAVGVIVLAVFGVTAFFDGMPIWKIAAMFVFFVVIVYSTQFINLHMFERTLDARFGRMTPPDEQPIEGRYQVTTQQPRAALPPPATVTAMRYTEHGVTRPMGAKPTRAPVQVETVADDGETLTVPLIRLQRFLSLPTPSRAEWIGERKLYSECASFCMAHGLLNQDKRGGYSWKPEYDRNSRREWALQFDPSPTLPAAREIGSRPVNADE